MPDENLEDVWPRQTNLPSGKNYTALGYKSCFFRRQKAQFVTVGII